jgi:hypothetical protein
LLRETFKDLKNDLIIGVDLGVNNVVTGGKNRYVVKN